MVSRQESGSPEGLVVCSPGTQLWVEDARISRIVTDPVMFTAIQAMLRVSPAVVPHVTVLRSPDEAGLRSPDAPGSYVDYSNESPAPLGRMQLDAWRRRGLIVAELSVAATAWRGNIEGYLATRAALWSVLHRYEQAALESGRPLGPDFSGALGKRNIGVPPQDIGVPAEQVARMIEIGHTQLYPYRVSS